VVSSYNLDILRYVLDAWIATISKEDTSDRLQWVDSVENSRPAPASHASSGESAFFARSYVKSESWTFCAKHRFQSQTRTFLQWKPKPTFSTESVENVRS